MTTCVDFSYCIRGLDSKETAALYRWGVETNVLTNLQVVVILSQFLTFRIDLYHTAAMLSLWRIKSFVFARQASL